MIMRFTVIYTVFALAAGLLMLSPQMAVAGTKDWLFGTWPGSHWENQDFQPYTESVRHTHHPQWEHREWEPRDWSAQYGKPVDVIKGFYDADIIRDQYMCDERPVLEVGPNFYHLGAYDKQRAMKMVDFVYAVTADSRNGTFSLRDWRTDKTIGVYTRFGLQMK